MQNAAKQATSLALDKTKEKWDKTIHMLKSSLGKIVLFLFVVMPIVFLMVIALAGYLMKLLQGWPFERGYDFMSGAVTGGAIVFPADPPDRVSSKVLATIAACSGVGLFGFMVAILSNSMSDPLVKVLGLAGDDDGSKSRNVFPKLGALAAIVIVVNLVMAVLFGFIFSLVEPDLGLVPAIKTVASVELGGGIVFADQAYPKDTWGLYWYCIIGIWAIGVASLMISVVGGPGVSAVEGLSGIHLEEGEKAKSAAKKLAILVVAILPLTLLLAMLLVACIMAPLTSWTFEQAFWAGLPATTGGACALSSAANPPLTETGVVILIAAASAGFFMISLAIGIGGELMSPIVNSVPYLATKKNVTHSLISLFLISYVMIPCCVMVLAAPVGAIMSFAEGWHFSDGFWWCVAVQLGGGMALTGVQVHGFSGMLIGTVAVAWSIGISIFSVGLSGAPVVEPLMDALGMTADADELKELLGPDHFKIVRKQQISQTSYGGTDA